MAAQSEQADARSFRDHLRELDGNGDFSRERSPRGGPLDDDGEKDEKNRSLTGAQLEEILDEKMREIKLKVLGASMAGAQQNNTEMLQMMCMTMMQSMQAMQQTANATAAAASQALANAPPPIAPIPTIEKKIDPAILREIEKEGKTWDDKIFTLLKGRKNEQKLKDAEKAFAEGRLPPCVRLYNSSWNSTSMEETWSGCKDGEGILQIQIPQGLSRRQVCRAIHWDAFKAVSQVELEAVSEHSKLAEKAATMEAFKEVVSNMQAPTRKTADIFGRDIIADEYISSGPKIEKKTEEIYREAVKRVEKKLQQEERDAEKKAKQEKANLEKLEQITPEIKIQEFVDSRVEQVVAAKLMPQQPDVEMEGETEAEKLKAKEKKEKEDREKRTRELEESRKLLESIQKGNRKGKGYGKGKGNKKPSESTGWRPKNESSPGSRPGHNSRNKHGSTQQKGGKTAKRFRVWWPNGKGGTSGGKRNVWS